MKSISQISSSPRFPRSDSHASRECPKFPSTDQSYQSSVETHSAGSTTSAKETRGLRELRTFRNISNEFFGSEATVAYVAEAVFFAWITCIAAWPVGLAIYQLMRWTI